MTRLFNILTSAAFVTILILPLANMVSTPSEQVSQTEQRTLAQPPTLDKSLPVFIEQSESFLNDQFGYREDLIHWNNRLRVTFFSQSPVKDVTIGKDGWLFLNTNDLMDDHRGIVGLPEEGIAHLNEYFEQRYTWLEQRDISYLVVFAPDKQSIYPEFLPSVYQDVVEPKNTLLDVFMANAPTMDILDLRHTLLAAKSLGQLYAKLDTHWNMRGAYLAYTALIGKLLDQFPDLSVLPVGMLRVTEFEASGDLARLLSMEEELTEILPRLMVPRRNRCAEPTEENVTTCAGRPLRVMMFHDSFGNGLKHYLSETFGEIMYVQARFVPDQHRALIESFQPDLVIDEIVERWLSIFDGKENE
jgi:hypothetical protein